MEFYFPTFAKPLTVSGKLKTLPVEDQLQILITQYEEEQIQLKKFIDECLVETEYEFAHYHLQALYILNARIRTLKSLDDKLFDEKDSKKKRIEALQKLIAIENSDFMKEYYLKVLQSNKKELEQLNQIPKQTPLPYEKNLFEETFQKLVSKKIKNLKLILKKSDNLFLSLYHSKKILKVTLPYIKQHEKKWILDDREINSLKHLGFSLSENETKLILLITGENDIILNRLKLILSKIVFEIFNYKEFNNESFIQFTEKACR